VIHTNSLGKRRSRLVKEIALALRELMGQQQANATTKDLAAFIGLSLQEIAQGIDRSVAAWEKRGYWVKADRFRLEWEWSERLGANMRKAVLEEDWGTVALSAAQVAQKIGPVTISPRHRMGAPWTGAWKALQTGSDGA